MRHDKPPTTPFEIGDRVRVNCPGSTWHGCITSIASVLRFEYVYTPAHRNELRWIHFVDIRSDTIWGPVQAGYSPHELIPIGDQLERGSWDAIENTLRDAGMTPWNPTKQREYVC